MRVLVLSSKPPYPIHDGAAIRTFQSIVFLNRMGYEVDVLYFSEHNDKETVEKGLSKYCRNIYQHTMSATMSRINVFKGLFTNCLPLQVNYYFSKKVKRWILDHQDDYDMIYCNNIR